MGSVFSEKIYDAIASYTNAVTLLFAIYIGALMVTVFIGHLRQLPVDAPVK
jgi:hypothetical protein